MRSYVPNTAAERKEMLNSIGFNSIDELFSDIPEKLRLTKELELDNGKSEIEIRRIFKAYAENTNASLPIFRGAGAYRHYIPALIPQIVQRSEFYTAYTPYQAEMSQGMLQAIFEYQTLMCNLTGLDVSNASVYDGATAAAEATNMISAISRKSTVLISEGLNPDVRETICTYARFSQVRIVEIPLNDLGVTDTDALIAELDGAAGFLTASPNYFGNIENMDMLTDIVHRAGALMAAYVNPISLGMLKRPGDYNADIAVGDAQPLGLPLSFGGPYCGFICAKQKYLRNLPGRISGLTTDSDGNRVYVLTLQAREQHIRRERASSNICSNQMLCAISASIYLSVMGPQGLREVAYTNIQKAHYLAQGMKQIKGIRLRYPDTAFFNEFTVDINADPIVVNTLLRSKGYIGGLILPARESDKSGMLFCATEMNTREEIDGLLTAIEEVLS